MSHCAFRPIAIGLLLLFAAMTVVIVDTNGAAPTSSVQDSQRIDFRRQIGPLLAEHCITCHGPNEERGGLRLDQRSSATKLAGRRVVPGSSTYSLVYQRILHDRFGPRMPPTAPLSPEQIALVKDWIDQGAEWPDDLANDEPAVLPDPGVVRLAAALRLGSRRTIRALATADSGVLTRKGAGGSTPLMYAALYGNVEAVRLFLDRGADPNAANESGATALMWAVHDVSTTRVLLERGADVNARSRQGQTALTIAAGRSGSKEIVSLLLDRGAQPLGAALVGAAAANDPEVFQLLTLRGGDVRPVAARVLTAATRANCQLCADFVIEAVDRRGLDSTLLMLAPFGQTRALAPLLAHGANVNAVITNARPDIAGRTPLMLAAASDFVPAEAVQMLLGHGADVNATGPLGETALDLARRNGHTSVVDLLVSSGARSTAAFPTVSVTPRPAPSVRTAIERSLPLLQRSDARFIEKTGCVSCHHNTMTAMAMAIARAKRLPVDESIARTQRTTIASLLESQRELVRLGGSFTTNAASNALVGLAAEGYPADETTDAFAYYLRMQQLADGRWRNFGIDHRPPIQGSDVEVTATAVRALRAYAPVPQRAEYRRSVDRAVAWLMRLSPQTTDERAMQLLGLAWAGVSPNHAALRRAGDRLMAEQRPDGGWRQLSTLESDAYATGQALVALHAGGMLARKDVAYQRAVDFLMRTQGQDGSWYVKTRSIPFQPYFESGFPHGPDQWISMAATNWAVTALANTIVDGRTPAAGPP
jgi:ankyrin repeat protein